MTALFAAQIAAKNNRIYVDPDMTALLSEHAENKNLGIVLSSITKEVSAGGAFHKALEKHPKVFDEIWVSLVQAGEVSGQLPTVLRQITAYCESQEAVKSKIITAVSFPVPAKAGYAKFPNPASRYAIVGVFVAKTGSGARAAVTGAGPCVFRDKAIEQALSGSWSADAVKGSSSAAGSLNSDIHASGEYRAHLIGVMAKRAVQAAG